MSRKNLDMWDSSVRLHIWIMVGLLVASLTGCSSDGGEIAGIQGALKEFNYTAGGRTYTISYRYDTIAGRYLTRIWSVATPLSKDGKDDTLVQNTLRDAFRAQKICGPRLHPGILPPYGAVGNSNWGAHIKCSSKHQQNI